ncbi:MAG: hypothetical protein IIA02_04480 [Proteobacteria bacterium]|uniref:hypothetical protein n=1 Tax=Aquabacterium sp. TaxID=1872578 RepID=UPI0035C6F7A0|nr:hypothetical protein [Pseudomonadota bacterium]
MSTPSALPSPLPHHPPLAVDEPAPRWPWVAIGGCVLMLALLGLARFSEVRMARASAALHDTWLPTAAHAAELHIEVSDLARDAASPQAWTRGQARGRISDGIARLTRWAEAHRQDLDATTFTRLAELRQRWADHLAQPDAAPPHPADPLHEVLDALRQLNAHCMAQGRRLADIAAGH